MPPYRDFELLRGEVVLQPVVDLALEVLVLLHLLDLLGLLLLVPHQVLLIVVLQRVGGQCQKLGVSRNEWGGKGR